MDDVTYRYAWGNCSHLLFQILTELNCEAANYCILASSIGTKADGDLLRCKLRLSRVRAWDHAKHAQNKIIPVLRRWVAYLITFYFLYSPEKLFTALLICACTGSAFRCHLVILVQIQLFTANNHAVQEVTIHSKHCQTHSVTIVTVS